MTGGFDRLPREQGGDWSADNAQGVSPRCMPIPPRPEVEVPGRAFNLCWSGVLQSRRMVAETWK